MKLNRNLPYWLLVAGAALWCSLPFLAAWGRLRGWPGTELIYTFFDPVCHQRPERSFALGGEPLAVCHRCLGLYGGFLAGMVLWPGLGPLRRWLLETPRAIVFFFLPMAIDVFLIPNTYATRFATGLVAALPVALLAWAAAEQIFHPTSDPPRESYEPG